jgi:adenosylcobinamide-phosphate synthase
LNVLLAALAVDALIGEPPAWLHPVVLMGRALSALERCAPRTERARLAFGAVAGLGLPMVWAALGYQVERRLPWLLRVLVFKATFAGRALLVAGRQVEDDLRNGDLSRARTDLRSLVSRPTSDLGEPLIAAAAIESLAENFVDSWLAPLLAYAAFGLGGAYAYRAANTADAVWGHRTPEYEWLGKVPARLDDVLNWIPARLGALLLVCLGPNSRRALEVYWRDSRRTSSPNAGQVMAACAGQLGVRLEKSGHYVLDAEAREPVAADIAAARRLVGRAMVFAALWTIAVVWLRQR